MARVHVVILGRCVGYGLSSHVHVSIPGRCVGYGSCSCVHTRKVCGLWLVFVCSYQEGVATVSTHHPEALRLGGQRGLGRLLLGDHHDGAEVDDASAVGRGTGTAQRCHADLMMLKYWSKKLKAVINHNQRMNTTQQRAILLSA